MNYTPDFDRKLSHGLFDPGTIAEATFRLRQQRRAVLGADLCNDVAWDLLLMMYLAPARPLTLETAASTLQASVAVLGRWLAVLESRGLVTQAQKDDQCGYVLTDPGVSSVERCCNLLTVND